MPLSQRRTTYYSPKEAVTVAPPAIEPQPPVKLHSLEAGVWLPILQAGITGIFIGASVAIVAYLADWPKPFAWFAAGYIFSQAVVWMALLWRWLGLTARVEQAIDIDLDGDGYTGPAPTLRVELAKDNDGGRQIAIMDLPTTPEKLSTLAHGLLAGLPLSEGTWCGRNGLFTRGEWRAVRAQLQARGLVSLAQDRDHRSGYQLTPAGQSAMRYFASLTEKPPILAEKDG